MADSTPTIRAGIVGSGFAARFHLEAMRKVYGVNVDITGADLESLYDVVIVASDKDVLRSCSMAATKWSRSIGSFDG